jgi:hypothetical protein
MNLENYQEFRLNEVKATLILNTKRHVWQIWFNWDGKRGVEPDLEFTKAKGACVVKFLQKLKEFERNNETNKE